MNNKPLFHKRLITAFAIVSSIVIYFITKDYLSEFSGNWTTLTASTNGEAASAVTASLFDSLAFLIISTLLSIMPLIATIIAWNNRRIGGWVFILLAIIGVVCAQQHYHSVALLVGSALAGVAGLLFLWHHQQYPKKRRRKI
ncbi:MAG: hypothetical protein WCP79_03125 [Bacillota bacterium]